MKSCMLMALLAAFTLITPAALAQGLPGASVDPDAKAKSAERDAQKGNFAQRCKDNPQQCEEMKAKMKAHREQCKADPQKCAAERNARREEWCKANPQRCD